MENFLKSTELPVTSMQLRNHEQERTNRKRKKPIKLTPEDDRSLCSMITNGIRTGSEMTRAEICNEAFELWKQRVPKTVVGEYDIPYVTWATNFKRNHARDLEPEILNKPIPRTTQWYRERGRPPKSKAAEDQKKLKKEENDQLYSMLVDSIHQGQEMTALALRKEALNIQMRRPTCNSAEEYKLPGRNWASDFKNFYGDELRRVRAKTSGWQYEGRLEEIAWDLVATPSDAEHLCIICAAIKVNINRMLASRKCESRQFRTFDFENNGNPICKLCQFILACWKSWKRPQTGKLFLKISHLDNVFGPTTSGRKFLFSLSDASYQFRETHRGWIFPTLLAGPTPDGISRWGSPGRDVNFGMILSWLEFCNGHHEEFCAIPTDYNIPFFYLIECSTRRIIESTHKSKYAALSYCWGPKPHPLPHESNDLPSNTGLVIEDAIKVAIRLKIPFLWVDRYYIAQGDDTRKPQQLQNMDKVYDSAYVTIIAGYGDRPECGLPGVSTQSRKPPLSMDSHGHRLTCIPDIVQEIQDCPWSKRGWTFQENVLCRRKLVFTETQVYFQCKSMHCCEATPINVEETHTAGWKGRKYTHRAFPERGIGKTGSEIVDRVQEYIKRTLTNESDALVAFLGVFQAFQELKYPVYHFWGLPMSEYKWTKDDSRRLTKLNLLGTSMLSSLAWSNGLCQHNIADFPTRRAEFPSWTWAAWKGLGSYSRMRVTDDDHSPAISFRMHGGRLIELQNYKDVLASGMSISLFEPCLLLQGWVTDVRFEEITPTDQKNPVFQVTAPISTHRVSLVMDEVRLRTFRKQIKSRCFKVIVVGSDSTTESTANVSHHVAWHNVHALILDAQTRKRYSRLGVVVWSSLSMPAFDIDQSVMRVKELMEVRRVVPPCQCGCQQQGQDARPFDRFLEVDDSVMEFQKRHVELI